MRGNSGPAHVHTAFDRDEPYYSCEQGSASDPDKGKPFLQVLLHGSWHTVSAQMVSRPYKLA